MRIRDKFRDVFKPAGPSSSSRSGQAGPVSGASQAPKGGDQGPIQSTGFIIGGVADSDALRELQKKVSGNPIRTDSLVKIASKDPYFATALGRIADDLENREGSTEREQALGKLIRTYLS